MDKLLLIHNNYQNIGGEDIAVRQEIEFLKKHFELRELIFDNSELRTPSQLFNFLFNSNRKSKKRVLQEIEEFNPDVAYVHNTWFSASLSIFKALKSKNIKVILKLHNYRFFCTRSYLINNHIQNEYCMACGIRKKYFSFFNKYFKESYLKSFLVNRYGRKYYKIIKNFDGTIVCLTEFQRNFLRNLGFRNRIETLPNNLHSQLEFTNSKKENNVIYAGRISEEKGIEELITSFRDAGLKKTRLVIIGDGPDHKYLVNKYGDMVNISFLGYKTNFETLKLIANSRAVVTATKLYEGQPTLLTEASLSGTPSIFPDTGGVSEFFPKDYPLMFEQFNYFDLISKMQLVEDEKLIVELGSLAREHIENSLKDEYLIKKFKEFF